MFFSLNESDILIISLLQNVKDTDFNKCNWSLARRLILVNTLDFVCPVTTCLHIGLMTGAGLFLRLAQRQVFVVEAFGRESGRCCSTLILVRPDA